MNSIRQKIIFQKAGRRSEGLVGLLDRWITRFAGSELIQAQRAQEIQNLLLTQSATPTSRFLLKKLSIDHSSDEKCGGGNC